MPTVNTQFALQRDETTRLGRAVFLAALLIVWALLGWSMAGTAFAAQSTVAFQKTNGSDCSGTACEVRLGKIGKSQRVHIESVSCYLSTDAVPQISGAQLEIGSKIAQPLVPVLVGKASAEPSYALNHKVDLIAKSGQAIRVRVFSASPDQLDDLSCKVAGTVTRKR